MKKTAQGSRKAGFRGRRRGRESMFFLWWGGEKAEGGSTKTGLRSQTNKGGGVGWAEGPGPGGGGAVGGGQCMNKPTWRFSESHCQEGPGFPLWKPYSPFLNSL